MAMAAGVTASAPVKPRRAWRFLTEPFRINGTELPPNVLLMAKLTVFAFAIMLQFRNLPSHFVPFWRVLDHAGTPAQFHYALVVTFLVAAGFLLFNRGVRVACLVLGVMFILAVLSSRLYYENNRFFTGCILLLAGLSSRGREPWPLRLQLALVYFGAGLNKVLEADWRSGQFFLYWFGHVREPELWARVTTYLPARPLAQFADWTTILVEFVLVVGFLVPRLFKPAVWTAVVYHTIILVLTKSMYGMFYYALAASYLVFFRWPKDALPVLYDGDCGLCERTRRVFEWLDLEGRFRWVPFQRAEKRYGISEEALRERVHVVAGPRVHGGFSAFKLMLMYNPASYFAAFALLAFSFEYQRWVAVAVLLLFSPLATPVGNAVYRWVAHHRSSMAASNCARGAA